MDEPTAENHKGKEPVDENSRDWCVFEESIAIEAENISV